MKPTITSARRTVGGYGIHYLEAGTGPPVVLLHGFAVSCAYWRPTLEVLARAGYHAVAMDVLGFGESEKSHDAPYSLRLYADLAVGLLDALGLQDAAFVGHSFGGKLAIATALFHPQRVSKLVPIDNDGFTPLTSQFMRKLVELPKMREFLLWVVARRPVARKQLYMAFYEPEKYVTTELIEEAHRALYLPDNRAVLLQMSHHADEIDFQQSGLRLRLHELQCPTLIVWGAEDRIFPASCAEAALREIPGARLVVIPRCGHFPHVEAFRAFHGVLLGFLAGTGLNR